MAQTEESTVRAAAAQGRLSLLREFHQGGADVRAGGDEALREAAAGGHLSVVRYLHENGADLRARGDEALRRAAAGGHLDVVRYLHENGADLRARGDEALRRAAASGHLAVVRYLRGNGADLRARGDEALRRAAAGGHLDVVRYLHRNGGDLRAGGDEALRRAAAGGHLDVVRYLHENGADLRARGDEALRRAAAGGHLDVIRYLHQNGLNVRAGGDEPLREAAAGGHLAVVRYLHENGADLRAQGDEALRRAAAGGHGAVVAYLHEQGATTSDLSAEGRRHLDSMTAELAGAPPVYQPSRFWQEVGAGHMRLLTWTGEANFKKNINQNYFDFVPSLSETVASADPATTVESTPRAEYWMEPPDRDPTLWSSWCPSYQVFKQDPERQADIYARRARDLCEFVLAHDCERLLERLDEPLLGNPIRVWRNGRLVSQDLAHSVWERRSILEALSPEERPERLVLAELGAGYGRLGHVLLASTGWRYVVFDIPPALYLAQWYLTTLFPERRAFRFRRFERFSEVEAEFREADMAFFTANQLEKLPDTFADIFVNISSLHEMRPDQVAHFLGLMARKTTRVIYLKEHWRYENPYDRVILDRSAFTLPGGWRSVVDRADALDPDFFECLLRRGP